MKEMHLIMKKEELLHNISEITQAKDVLKAQYSELSSRLKQILDEGVDKDSLISKNLDLYEKNAQQLNLKIELLQKDIEGYKISIEELKQQIFNQKWDLEAELKSQEKLCQDKIAERDAKIEELQMELRVMGQKYSNSNKDSITHEREIQLKDSEIQQLK